MIDPAELAAQIAAPAPPSAAAVAQRLASGLVVPGGLSRRLGVITASNDDGTVMLTLGGDDVEVRARRLDSYLPRVGDTVSVLAGGGDLVVIGRVAAERPTPIGASGRDGTARRTTSTVYVELSLAMTVTVRTGKTGALLIGHSCASENTASASTCYQSFRVERTSDGAVVAHPVDSLAVAVEGTSGVQASLVYPLAFDPGVEYLVRLMHRVDGGEGGWEDRRLWALPL